MITAGTQLLRLWRRLSPLPAGPWLFSKLFGFAVPYSGSVRPRIRVLEAGHAVVEIPGRRSNRNHLGSVHAIALVNLAEITSGLDGPVVDVRLKGREPQFVITPPETSVPDRPPAPDDPVDDDGDGPTARITLRLPDGLKVRAEEAAARSRQSLNTWLVDAVRAAATGAPSTSASASPPSSPPRRGRAGTQLSGWAR